MADDKPSLEEILNSMPSYQRITFAKFESTGQVDEAGAAVPKRIVVVMSVGKKGWGFGEMSFIVNEQGQLFIDAETSSRETVKEFLGRMVDEAILDSDPDPEKHRLYNENTGVISCGCCGYEKKEEAA